LKLKINSSGKINIVLFIISLVLVTAVMFVYIGQKDGFHEDEIFSYGASNDQYNSVFYSSGERDATNRTVYDNIISEDFETTKSNASHYFKNPEEFNAIKNANLDSETPIWKTRQQAKDYLSTTDGEKFNMVSPYYHQVRDVHPPLFYYLVHIVSSIFGGMFSKYIIFGINLVFFLLTCVVMRKILILYNREYLVLPAIILYGLSMGAISTVIFLRMYAMFTFFTVAYFYITLKITKNNFVISKKTALLLILTTLAGFLTHYMFCLFAFFVFAIAFAYMLKSKKIKNAVMYTLYHTISAIIGLLLFPPAIYHIFYSSRGIGTTFNTPFFAYLNEIINRLLYSFSLNRFIGVAIFLIVISFIFVKLISKTDSFEAKRESLFNISLFVVPAAMFLVFMAMLIPNLNTGTMVRYVTPILPVVTVSFIVFAEMAVKLLGLKDTKKKTIAIYSLVALISVSGFIFNSPSYLYRGYDKYTQIAEKYKEENFVYVYDNYFTHQNSLPEMAIYKQTLIINYNDEKQMNTLSNDETLKDGNSYILSIKKWMINQENPDEILNTILESTGYENAELLHDGNDDTQSVIYLITKSDAASK